MSQHLTPEQRQGFLRKALPPDELLLVDEHLTKCPDCRGELETEYFGSRPAEPGHLVYEDLLPCLEGHGSRAALDHLSLCGICARDLADLRVERLRLAPARGPWWSGLFRPVPLAAFGAAAAAIVIFLALRPVPTLPAVALNPPRELLEMRTAAGVLLGEESRERWKVLEPVATMVESDRPRFRWQPLPGASTYDLEIYDDDFQVIAKGSSPGTEWIPATPLPRNTPLAWRVRSGDRSSPAPPEPEARFRVLTEEAARQWQSVKTRDAADPIRLATEAANLGLRQEALKRLIGVPGSERLVRQLSW